MNLKNLWSALHFWYFLNIYLHGIQETYQHQDYRRPAKKVDVFNVKRKGNTINAGQEHPTQLYPSQFGTKRKGVKKKERKVEVIMVYYTIFLSPICRAKRNHQLRDATSAAVRNLTLQYVRTKNLKIRNNLFNYQK